MGYPGSKTPKAERDSLETPWWLYNWLHSIYDFDIDLAASKENKKHSNWKGEHVNSLSVVGWKYEGCSIGFLNPPYSNIKPWVDKAIREQSEMYGYFTTVMVIPTPNGESYYKKIFKNATEIIYINGRVAFVDKDGKPKQGNNRGTCVVVFGKLGGQGTPRIIHVDRDELIEKYS